MNVKYTSNIYKITTIYNERIFAYNVCIVTFVTFSGVVYMNDYVLRYSLENNVRITIMYMKSLEFTQRDVQVKRIESDFVIAHCYTRNTIRKFNKDNILAATISGLVQKHIKYNRVNY